MLSIARQDEIFKIVNEKTKVTVEELAEELFVSPATIRRDLSQMEEQGLLRRTHGGAVPFVSSAEENAFSIREQENTAEKKQIALKAISLIEPGYTIFMDSSSTAGSVIPLLNNFKFLTVVTTGLRNALRLSQTSTTKIYTPGGQILNNSNSIVGSDTISFIEGIHADISILSAAGVDEKAGFTDSTLEQSKIKQMMSKNSRIVAMLCDSTKFNKTFMCTDLNFCDVDYLITNKEPPEKILEAISKTKCKILYSK